jgi:hypothetical protein
MHAPLRASRGHRVGDERAQGKNAITRGDDHHANTLVADTNQACIDACTDCAQARDACAYTCCVNDAAMADCPRLSLLARSATWAARLCQLCAEISDACAAECERFDAQACQTCAQACRACADQCRAMATST